MRKRFIRILVGIVLAASLIIGCTTGVRGGLTPGRFEAEAFGFFPNSRYSVFVTVGSNAIVDIEFDDRVWCTDVQTINHGQLAMPFLRQRVLEHQTIAVDGVAGVTVTSMGFLSAVGDALRNANAPRRMFNPPTRNSVTKDVDILIMGSGIAGLTAAVKAKTNAPNANVVLIEKMDFPGGSTIISGQIFTIPRNDADVTVFENYIIARGRGQVSEVLSRHWVRNAQRVYAFLNNRDPGWIQGLTENSVADHSGTDLQHRTIYMGAPFNGFHPTSVVPMLLARFQRLGGTVMLGVQGLSLITDTNGTVTGAVARNRRNNTEITFRASTGVILATGGYGHNRQLRILHNPGPQAFDPSQSTGGAQGQGIIMAQAVGAGTTFNKGLDGMGTPHPYSFLFVTGKNMVASGGITNHFIDASMVSPFDPARSWFQNPFEPGGPNTNYVGQPHDVDLLPVNYDVLNPMEYAVNYRWAMETRKNRGEATKFWSLYAGPGSDQLAADHIFVPYGMSPISVIDAMNRGWVIQSTTIQGLAEQLRNDDGTQAMTAVQLRDAFFYYRLIPSATYSVTDPTAGPFVAQTYYLSDVGTIGGININIRGEVLRYNANSYTDIIHGLFAAGETANGQLAFREYPTSGFFLTTGAVFGYSAGQAAAARFNAR